MTRPAHLRGSRDDMAVGVLLMAVGVPLCFIGVGVLLCCLGAAMVLSSAATRAGMEPIGFSFSAGFSAVVLAAIVMGAGVLAGDLLGEWLGRFWAVVFGVALMGAIVSPLVFAPIALACDVNGLGTDVSAGDERRLGLLSSLIAVVSSAPLVLAYHLDSPSRASPSGGRSWA